jgi:CTP:molybdopterin cytidylyltransferase MocA/SAM-dependent methyltransferase
VPARLAALVLAAGASSRFGAPKALARLDGKPLLEHVLDALRDAGVARIVVVLGHAADEIEERIDWLDEVVVRNPDPRHLSSSLQVGLDAVESLEPPVDGVIVALGDQPRTRPEVVRALVAAARHSDRPVVVPRYADGGGANPILLTRAAFDLVDETTGDRGLGPVLADHEDVVEAVPVEGSNPDVDTPGDLAALVWAERVRANRDQVDRVREVPDGHDFYAPVSALFRADPRRDDEPVLDRLRELVVPGETWLDIGAGAGRYALPLALLAGEVVAVDPSPAMLDALREQADEHGIRNVRAVEGRWPPEPGGDVAAALGEMPQADVALIAHVGYDVEAIGPFLDAMEAAASRLCVAVLMERQPASAADPFWPPVHGEARVPLPALPEFLDLLRARGREPAVTVMEREPRAFASRDDLSGFVRRQLWVADGGEKERRFAEAFASLAVETPRGWELRDARPLPVGVATWAPFG